MLERFFPREFVDSIHDISYNDLKERGVKALLFDVDNTLAPYDIARPPEETAELFGKLIGMGFKIALISNNKAERLLEFNKELGAIAVSKAGKPGVKGVETALAEMGIDKSEAVIIGDQIFTDIWCGNRSGIYSILVKPMSKREEYYIKLKRVLEKIVIRRYFRYKKSNIALNKKRVYNDEGFTLTECIVTIGIAAVFSTMILLALPSSGTRELDEACRTLQADMRMAQRLSVIEGRKYRVEFDTINNSYKVSRMVTSSVTQVIKSRKFEKRIDLVNVTGNTDRVDYTPTGTSGDPCKITMANEKYSVNLTINLGSGRIEIKDYIKK